MAYSKGHKQRTIEALTAKIVAFRDARDWRRFHTPKDSALSLMVESAELGELFQFKGEQESWEIVKKKRPELEAELADCLYWVLLMAHDFEIDLPKAFNKKMKENVRKYPVAKARGKNRKYTEL